MIGVDFNEALVREAQRLSAAEQLDCRFEVINAFKMARPATVYLSTGVLHHFRGDGLDDFLLQHDQPDTQAFVHYDFQPTPLARPGAWAFHYIRMREPLSRHDGVVSARRAHDADTFSEFGQADVVRVRHVWHPCLEVADSASVSHAAGSPTGPDRRISPRRWADVSADWGRWHDLKGVRPVRSADPGRDVQWHLCGLGARGARIDKRAYFVNAMIHGIGWGQVACPLGLLILRWRFTLRLIPAWRWSRWWVLADGWSGFTWCMR
ncbi:MAG: hypothetical protein Ct9H300mP1_19440 [Planctomycetaceae bacterium]|nr:MAG: hypothetical protein Ct9H300mP1_19440 [Planctomycetaceae bacterium]